MKALIERIGIDVSGKKVLVLGTDGTSKTACVVAKDLEASKVLTVSRKKGEYITYNEAILNHADAEVIINTTSSGMHPDCGSKPIGIMPFAQVEGAVDAVYNPLRTNLVLDAKERGIKAECGLYMLVMQAVVTVEKFLDTSIPKERADRVFADIFASKENIVLTGMPGSGKSTVGNLLHVDGFEFLFFLDADLNRLQTTDSCPLSDTFEKLQKLYEERIDIYSGISHVIVPDLGTVEAEASYKRKKLIL